MLPHNGGTAQGPDSLDGTVAVTDSNLDFESVTGVQAEGVRDAAMKAALPSTSHAKQRAEVVNG